MKRLTDSEECFVVNALRVAAVQYATDAHVHADHAGLKRQFLEQADKANKLADAIEAEGLS